MAQAPAPIVRRQPQGLAHPDRTVAVAPWLQPACILEMPDHVRATDAAGQQRPHPQQHRPHVAAGVLGQVHDPAATAAIVQAPERVPQTLRVLLLGFPLLRTGEPRIGQIGPDRDPTKPRVDPPGLRRSRRFHSRGQRGRGRRRAVPVAQLRGRHPPAMTGGRAVDGVGQQRALPFGIGGRGKLATQRPPVHQVPMQRPLLQQAQHLLPRRQRGHRGGR